MELNHLQMLLQQNCSLVTWSSIALLVLFGYWGAPFILWAIVLLTLAICAGLPQVALLVFAAILAIFALPPIRRLLISSTVMKIMKSILPPISDTERTALDAGVVWVEQDLFSGRPDFKKLRNEPYPKLSTEEQQFIDGPVEKLCAMIDDWKIWQTREIPAQVWDFIKKERFLGMIIPKEFGGLGFSALAHSAVIQKVCARSVPVGVTIMVPNSLGPAELLVHYGTQQQKEKLLPKLASGEEIPCFGLTEPNAGSDAGSIISAGTLFKGEDGQLKLKVNWNKRWITLAAVSTTIGLAFRVSDPEGLMGEAGADLGITCALIPAKTPGVVIGNRHDPLGVPFYNCPTHGKDVVVDVEECVVGGAKGIGIGWSMLMACLGAGRGISLPSQSGGGAKVAARASSAHGTVRKQFGMSIGKFEGIEEPMALIGGLSYMIEACRNFTCGAIDRGISPPVVTAIAKYQTTEAYRKIINGAMDIMGGSAISRGPRNILAHGYISTPIGITVEGANILTRTLIVFGQGALRAHPYAYQEIKSAEQGDLKGFDRAFWGHIGHVVRNTFRSVILSITRGFLAVGFSGGPLNAYYRKLAWCSASFAIMADIAMGALGGSLKVKEKLTGRYADILSWMYLNLAVMKKFEAGGSKKEDLPYVTYALEYGFCEIQHAFEGIFSNLKVPGLSWFFRGFIGRWARFNSFGTGPSDKVSHDLSVLMQTDCEQRERLHDGIYVPPASEEGLGKLEAAFKLAKNCEGLERKLKKAIRAKTLPKKPFRLILDEAVEKNVITADEKNNLEKVVNASWDAIQVNDFTDQEYKSYSTDAHSSGLN